MGWEALLEGQKGLRSPLEGLGGLRRVRRGQKALLEGLVGSRGYSGGSKGVGGPPGGPVKVGRLFWRARRAGLGRRQFRRARRVWEALLEGLKGSGGPPKGPGSIWRPIRWVAWSLEWSRSPPGGV